MTLHCVLSTHPKSREGGRYLGAARRLPLCRTVPCSRRARVLCLSMLTAITALSASREFGGRSFGRAAAGAA